MARNASCEISRRGPKPMPVAILSGSETRVARSSTCRLPDRDPVAELEVEPGEQRRVGDRAERAVALRKQAAAAGCGGSVTSVADRRIGGVDRLDLDERRALVAGNRHGAHGGDRATPCPCVRGRPARLACLAVDEREGHVAAEDPAALPGQPLGERARDRRRRRRWPRRRARCRRGRSPKPVSPPRSSRRARRRTSGMPMRRAGRAGRGAKGAVHRAAPQPAARRRPRHARSAAAPCGRSGGRGRGHG